MLKKIKISDDVTYSCFSNKTGNDGYFFTLTDGDSKNIEESLENIANSYQAALKKLKLGLNSIVFSRLYFSDIANQISIFESSRLYEDLQKGAHSCLEQWPINAKYLSLFVYHIHTSESTPVKELTVGRNPLFRNKLSLKGQNYNLLYTSNYSHDKSETTGAQTDALFGSLKNDLAKSKMTLLDNTVRTWVFVRDVDFNYPDMVGSRRKFFKAEGLNGNTRFPASTGIEGKMRRATDRVALESLSFEPVKEGQITTMEATEHLSPTIKYGVTFARGTKIEFGDRNHFYISGTASIDKNGEILHPGDIVKQTQRTLENIRALLKPHGADLDDMSYFIIYIRDPQNYAQVMKVFKDYIPDSTPHVVLKAAVCRPGWLVEIEGMALSENDSSFPDFL